METDIRIRGRVAPARVGRAMQSRKLDRKFLGLIFGPTPSPAHHAPVWSHLTNRTAGFGAGPEQGPGPTAAEIEEGPTLAAPYRKMCITNPGLDWPPGHVGCDGGAAAWDYIPTCMVRRRRCGHTNPADV